MEKKKWSVNPKKVWNNGVEMYEVNHGEDGEVIAEGVYTLEHAKLIAAAPQLLEALQDTTELLGYLINALPDCKARTIAINAVTINKHAIKQATT